MAKKFKKISRSYMRHVVVSHLIANGIKTARKGMSNSKLANLIREVTGKFKDATHRQVLPLYFNDLKLIGLIKIPKTINPSKKPKQVKSKNLSFVQEDEFLRSYEWRRARYIALKKSNGKCQLCGRSSHNGIVLNVDHIKPRKTHPELALDQKNFQVLCGDCNHGKGNLDDTDWRKKENLPPNVVVLRKKI